MGVYTLVTLTARAAGLVRELLLLSVVGIGRDLDGLVLVLVVPSLVTLLVASTIYTNITPRAARAFEVGDLADPARSSDEIERLLSEGVRFGLALTLVAAVANTALVALLGIGGTEPTTTDFSVALIVSLTVLFTVVSEYLSALLTARQDVGYLVAGNLFISLPAIAALALLDLTVATYAIVFSLSFAFRLFYLLLALRASVRFRLLPIQRWRETRVPRWSRSALWAGSALIGVQLTLQLAVLLARFLPVGSVSLLYYGLRLPQLYLSTVWFVLGTDFFGAIQQLDAAMIKARLRQVTVLNGALLGVVYVVGVPLVEMTDLLVPERWESLRLDDIVRLSLFCFPLIVFVPLVDMAQKTMVTIGDEARTLRIAVVLVATSMIFLVVGAAIGRVETLLVGLTIGLGFGAVASVYQLMRVDYVPPVAGEVLSS